MPSLDPHSVASSDAFVSFDRVQKSYDGETLVVEDFNLTIERGEFLTLLGPSGSGKTTCLLMLAGFEVPSAGQIRLAGEVLDNIPPHRREIGLVFQNYALFPHMTVAENLAFPLKVRKFDKSTVAQKVSDTLAMVRLQGFEHRKPSQLSGGQQQRVAVARALIFDPKILLMDEPLSALDKNLRDQMQIEIRDLHRTLGITVVYVTHDQSEAMTMSSRIVVFDEGTVQQVAPPSELYEKPQNAFVAQFVGENNSLHGTVEKTQGKCCLVRLSSGENIEAENVGDNAKGAQVLVSLRPERVQLAANASDLKHCCNKVKGKLQEKIFLGDHMRARFFACNKEGFVVNLPNKEGIEHVKVAKEGQDMALGWRVEDCRALGLSKQV